MATTRKPSSKAKASEKMVIVTTEFRGVFVGEIKNQDKAPGELVLKNARNVIYFGTDKGLWQLATTGPTKSTKVGTVVDELTLYKVTSVSYISEEARAAWDAKK